MQRLTILLCSTLFLGCGADTVRPADDDRPPTPEPEPLSCPPGERLVAQACVPAGVQDDGCPAGTMMEEGTCKPAGMLPEDCAEGFVHSGDVACDPILPSQPCPAGTWAVPGDLACRDFSACGDSPWPEVGNASVVYVDATATAPPEGTQGAPYPNLTAAVEAAADGDVVAIAAGTYQPVLVTKRVTLWGRCADMVTIEAGPLPALPMEAEVGVSLGAGASGSVVRSLAVSGSGVGIAVGHADVTLTDLWLHDLTAMGIAAFDLGPDSSITISNVFVERTTYVGIYLEAVDVDLREVAVTDVVTPEGLGGGVYDHRGGIVVPWFDHFGPADGLVIDRVHIRDVQGHGIATNSDDAISVSHAYIHDVTPRPNGKHGAGLIVEGPATIDSVVIADVVEAGLDIPANVDSFPVDVQDVVIRDVLVAENTGRGGYGIRAHEGWGTPAAVFARRVLVQGASEAGGRGRRFTTPTRSRGGA